MDLRSPLQKKLDEVIGPPLYYSDRCKLAVKVTIHGSDVRIDRPCGDCDCPVIAPRKAIAVGRGGMNMKVKVMTAFNQMKAALTGRCA